MADIDYVQILLGFLGGSGLAGLVVTYLQFREERKERARDRLSELVMTPRLRLLFGTVVVQAVGLAHGIRLIKELSTPEMLSQVVKTPKAASVKRNLKEFEKWLRETRLNTSKLDSRFNAALENGDLLLVPITITKNAFDTVKLASKLFDCYSDAFESFAQIALTSSRSRPPSQEHLEKLKEDMSRAEDGYSRLETASRNLNIGLRNTLGLTVLEE